MIPYPVVWPCFAVHTEMSGHGAIITCADSLIAVVEAEIHTNATEHATTLP